MVLVCKMPIHTILSMIIYCCVLIGTPVMSCPDQCYRCNYIRKGYITTDCMMLGLRTVPAGIPTNTQKLWLHHNQITTLSNGSFSGLTNLRSLWLYNNQIRTLSPGVFTGLTNLRWLSLSSNQITTLSTGLFTGLTNLRTLSLFDNQITTLSTGLFTDLTNLRTLYLNNNQIATLGTSWFSGPRNLRLLWLQGNPLLLTPSLYTNLRGLGTFSTGYCTSCNRVDQPVKDYLEKDITPILETLANETLQGDILRTDAASESLKDLTNSQNLAQDDVKFASKAIANIAESVSTNIHREDLTGQITNRTFQAVDNILNLTTVENVTSLSSGERMTRAMDMLVVSLRVGPHQILQETKSSLGYAVTCPAGNVESKYESFRSRYETQSGFFLGGTNQTAEGTTSGVAVDIDRSALDKVDGVANSSCGVAPIRYILYKTDALFGKDFKGETIGSIESEVISIQVGHGPEKTQPVPVSISFDTPPREKQEQGRYLCAYWIFGADNALGYWTDEGCSTSTTSRNRTLCECDHLTNFAMLFVPDYEDNGLKWVSIIGCGTSMLAIVSTILLILIIPKLRQSIHHRILLGYAITLLIFIILFTIALYDSKLNKSSGACKAVAAILQYLILCVFMWLSFDATILHQKLVVVLGTDPEALTKWLLISVFATPFIIVGITAGATQFKAYSDETCWMKQGPAFYGGFVAPLAILLCYNIVILVRVTMSLRNRQASTTKKGGKNNSALRVTVSLSLLLGLTWILGFFILIHEHKALLYIFVILNSTQGVYLFVHVIIGKETRKGLRAIINKPRQNKKAGEMAKPTRSKQPDTATTSGTNQNTIVTCNNTIVTCNKISSSHSNSTSRDMSCTTDAAVQYWKTHQTSNSDDLLSV
ncbi:adhesion G-protein coupled receptor G7-like [Sycon ciliatum]|uniref:adhesion G-protein coupled receptor G7-like n=1 Tax=Sycon ciliatum TaxID=27933 RepID=UPI0031F60EB4